MDIRGCGAASLLRDANQVAVPSGASAECLDLIFIGSAVVTCWHSIQVEGLARLGGCRYITGASGIRGTRTLTTLVKSQVCCR